MVIDLKKCKSDLQEYKNDSLTTISILRHDLSQMTKEKDDLLKTLDEVRED